MTPETWTDGKDAAELAATITESTHFYNAKVGIIENMITTAIRAACAEAVKAESIPLRAERDRLRDVLKEVQDAITYTSEEEAVAGQWGLPMRVAVMVRKALEGDADET